MDGKRERMFRDGRRMVVFVNGTIKEEYPSGLSIVRFTNGDIKKAYKNGAHPWLVGPLYCVQSVSRLVKQFVAATCLTVCCIADAGLVEYLYAEVDTWHTTCTDGTQVFHFASGQAEAHRPDGSKEVCLMPTDRAALSAGLPVLDVTSRKRYRQMMCASPTPNLPMVVLRRCCSRTARVAQCRQMVMRLTWRLRRCARQSGRLRL